jgi:hypothetical protein
VGLEPTQTGLRDRRTHPRLHTAPLAAHLVRGLGVEPKKPEFEAGMSASCISRARGGPARNRTGVSAFGEPSVVHDRDRIGTNLLHCAPTAEAPRIAATPGATAAFRLLLEARHGLRVAPARARQIVVVLIAVFLQPAPHMAIGLVTTHRASVHDWLHRWWPAQVLSLVWLVQETGPSSRRGPWVGAPGRTRTCMDRIRSAATILWPTGAFGAAQGIEQL